MIELNLTYEESKRILELGYDFSSVCTKFELKTDTEYRVVYGKITKRNNRTEIESSESMEGDGRIVHLRNRSMLDPLMVSIIPKAALEACLPEFKTNKAWFSMALDEYEEERTFYWAFYTAVTIPSSNTKRPRLLMRYVKNQMLYENMHSAYFKSAFEAFLWCHENYPEELKKKFDEVMG